MYQTRTLHGAGIFTNINLKNDHNAGKSVHGTYGKTDMVGP